MTTATTSRTAKATEAKKRKAQERAAERLREHGWLCLPPHVAAELLSALQHGDGPSALDILADHATSLPDHTA